jgi:hypothetical protein
VYHMLACKGKGDDWVGSGQVRSGQHLEGSFSYIVWCIPWTWAICYTNCHSIDLDRSTFSCPVYTAANNMSILTTAITFHLVSQVRLYLPPEIL